MSNVVKYYPTAVTKDEVKQAIAEDKQKDAMNCLTTLAAGAIVLVAACSCLGLIALLS